jgi:hypothetical protein
MLIAKLPFAVFRALLLAIAALTLIASVVTWGFFGLHTSTEDFGSIGIDSVATSSAATPCSRTLTAIQAGSPLSTAGAKVGDQFCFDREVQRGMDLLAGEGVGLQIIHAGQSRHVDLVAVSRPPLPRRIVYALMNPLVALVTTAIGVLIGLRGAQRTDLRALGMSLVLNGMVEPTSMPYGAALPFTIAFLISPLAPSLIFDFALQFPNGAVGPWRRRLALLRPVVYASSALMVVISWANRFTHWSGGIVNTIEGAYFPLAGLLITLVIVVGRKEAAGEVRARFNWLLPVFVSLGVSAFFTIGPFFPAQYDGWVTFGAYLMTLIFPLGLAYATLKHRVFDFGFAINRALVYTIISTILLIAFALTEFSVDKLLHFHGREANIVIDAFVALGVILAFHRIQHWVAHRVDHIFYHHWQEAAQRLEAFVDSAAHITRESVLLERFVAELDQFVHPGATALYLRRAQDQYVLVQASLHGAPATIDIDDPSLVQLRHKNDIVAVAAGAASDIASLAIPMTVRGKLDGFLLVADKPDGAAFRSDELKLLHGAATSVMENLEFLRFKQVDRENADLKERIRQLQHSDAIAGAVECP